MYLESQISLAVIVSNNYQGFRRNGLFIQKSEVISLRTSKKTLPGKKLAVYIGAVIAVLVLSYNLIKDLSFILISDKKGIIFA